jgi:hypothetical protein
MASWVLTLKGGGSAVKAFGRNLSEPSSLRADVQQQLQTVSEVVGR